MTSYYISWILITIVKVDHGKNSAKIILEIIAHGKKGPPSWPKEKNNPLDSKCVNLRDPRPTQTKVCCI